MVTALTSVISGYLFKWKTDLLGKRNVPRLSPDINCRNEEIVVSLTSFGRRVSQNVVYYTIISILKQTVKPNRIILWLDKDKWNEIIAKAIARIRDYAKDVRILVGGYYNNSVEAIKDLDEPYDENIVYNFHCYSPLIFTHQGAYWIDKMDRSFRMPFNSRNSDYSKYTVEYIGKEYLDKFDEEGNIDSSYFENLFAEAIEIAKKRDVPLYCGEYGVIDLADAKDCLEWLKCISKVFDKYDIGRALWSYKEMDFGLVDAHYDDVREDMIGLL